MTNIKFTNNSKKLTTLEANNNSKDITLKLPATEGTLITKEEVDESVDAINNNLSNNYRKMLPTITTNTIKVGKSETYKTVQEAIDAIQANDVKLGNPTVREVRIMLTSDVTETNTVLIQNIPFYIEIFGTSRSINWTLYSPAESNWYGSGVSVINTKVQIYSLTVTCKNHHFCILSTEGSLVGIYNATFNLTNAGLANCVGAGSGFYLSNNRGNNSGNELIINITLDNTLKHRRDVLFIDSGGPCHITHHNGVIYNITNTSSQYLGFFRARAGGSLNSIGNTASLLNNTIKIKGDLNRFYDVKYGCTVAFNGDFSEVRKASSFSVANIPLGTWSNVGCFIASGNPTAV